MLIRAVVKRTHIRPPLARCHFSPPLAAHISAYYIGPGMEQFILKTCDNHIHQLVKQYISIKCAPLQPPYHRLCSSLSFRANSHPLGMCRLTPLTTLLHAFVINIIRRVQHFSLHPLFFSPVPCSLVSLSSGPARLVCVCCAAPRMCLSPRATTVVRLSPLQTSNVICIIQTIHIVLRIISRRSQRQCRRRAGDGARSLAPLLMHRHEGYLLSPGEA